MRQTLLNKSGPLLGGHSTEALPAIDKLLGLSNIETTACYAHLAQNPVHETVKRNAESIAAKIP